MKRIMIIEDETALRDELSVLLKNAGYEPVAVTDYSNVSEQMKSANSDLILLDINLPNVNGENGADDYITKPYNPTILLLRISAVLKRSAKVGAVQIYHDVEVSTVKGSLTRNGSEQILTKNEMIIFQQLLDRQGEIVTRDELMTALWDNDEFVNDNALSVNVSRLRGKLAELGLPEAIETRKKQGYVLK